MMDTSPPSPWIANNARLLTPNATILDVACGGGRHSIFLDNLGHRVTALDIDLSALRQSPASNNMILIEADIEDNPWPLEGRQFDGVIVSNYLWRPLIPTLLQSVSPGGLLIYETFMRGNEEYGRPSNPDFLLKPDELRDFARKDFDLLDFSQGYVDQPKPAMKQSIIARKR